MNGTGNCVQVSRMHTISVPLQHRHRKCFTEATEEIYRCCPRHKTRRDKAVFRQPEMNLGRSELLLIEFFIMSETVTSTHREKTAVSLNI